MNNYIIKYFSLLLLPFITFGQSNKYEKFADSAERVGRQDLLIPYFEKENEKSPNNEDVLRWLGYLHLRNNNASECEKFYKRAIAVNPKCGMCYVNLAKASIIKKDFTSAQNYCNRAIEIDQDNADFYGFRGDLKAHAGDGIGAGFDFDKAVELDGSNYEHYLRRGAFDAKNGMLSSALMDFTKAVELAPDNYRTYFEKASTEFTLQKYTEALKDINRAIELDSTHPELFTGRAAIYAIMNEHELAINDYSKSIALDNKNYFAYYYRALEKYAMEDMDASCRDMHESFKLADTQNKDEIFLTELKNSIQNFCDTNRSGYFYQRGIASFNLNEYDEAIQYYTSGLKKFPENTFLLSFRGNAFFAKKKYKEAITDYQQAIAKKGNIVTELDSQRRKLYKEKKHLEKFIDGFIASDFYNLSASFFCLNDFNGALISINEAITIAPEMKEFGKENHFNLRGCILLKLRKTTEAIKDFDQCISLNPNFEFAYINRSIALLCGETISELEMLPIPEGFGNKVFNPEWKIPHDLIRKKTKMEIKSIMNDCDKAIQINPSLAAGYYLRGLTKRISGNNDFCKDIIYAVELGYPAEPELIKKCVK